MESYTEKKDRAKLMSSGDNKRLSILGSVKQYSNMQLLIESIHTCPHLAPEIDLELDRRARA